MRIETATIGPVQAKELLGHNVHNRNLRTSDVGRLAAAMRSGDWQLNGETIKVAPDGTLVDGQHRLAAIIKANVAVQVVIAFDVDLSAQHTVDTGIKRKLSDALKLQGESNPGDLAAALTHLYRYVNGKEGARHRGQRIPTIPEGLRLLEAHPGIRTHLSVGGALQKSIGYRRSLGTFLSYRLALIDEADAADFFSRLMSGAGLGEHSAILALRNIVERNSRAMEAMSPERMHALTIKAWNAYREGRDVRRLKWSPGGANPERFPQAI